MKGEGIFFLCGRPNRTREITTLDGDVQLWALPLVERTRRGVQRVTAYWRGAEADMFVQIHNARLKPGQALTLELNGIRPVLNELTASVTSCALAPDRWPAHEVDASVQLSQQEQQRAASNP